MNRAFKRLTAETRSGKPLTGTVLALNNFNGSNYIFIDYEGCRVIVPAPAETTWLQLNRMLGANMTFFVEAVDLDNGIAVGYCHTSPRCEGFLSHRESRDQRRETVHEKCFEGRSGD